MPGKARTRLGGGGQPAWHRFARATTALSTAVAGAGVLRAAANGRQLRRPADDPPAIPATRKVAVLVPARDEAGRIEHLISDLRRQRGVAALQVLVMDDASSDGTERLAKAAAGADPRFEIHHRADGPGPGWLGKPAACQRLAELADPDTDVLVFVDADVRLAEHAVAAAVDILDSSGMDLVSPWPRMIPSTWSEWLLQPLLLWTWMSVFPLRRAEMSTNPSMVVAIGQFLVFRAEHYWKMGGHAAVAGNVAGGVKIARAAKRAGGRATVVDGSALADVRMYFSTREVRDGYTKFMWATYGSPAGMLVAALTVTLPCVVPPLAALFGRGNTRLLGIAGYLAGVASRTAVARTGRSRAFPTVVAHPMGGAAYSALIVDSLVRRRRGALRWKGRPVVPVTGHKVTDHEITDHEVAGPRSSQP